MGQLNNKDWEHVDISAFIAGMQNDGVISGLAVSESTTPAMTVLVSAGSCVVNNIDYIESSGQNLNISNGDATHPRKDIIVYDTGAGNPAVVAGTPADAPVPPDIPSGDIYLAMVHVAANESTSIVNADIDEGRVYVRTGAEIRSYINVDDGADVTGSNTPQNHGSRHVPGAADTINGIAATISASDTLIFSNDTERTCNNVTPVQKKKEIIGTLLSGKIRVKWQMHGTSGYKAYARLYINGVDVTGRLETSSTTYVDYSHDVDINPGIDIALYGACGGGYTAYFRNFRIYGTQTALTIQSNDP